MITESGSMSWMSPNMKMETVSGGGMKKMFGRMMSGDSAFQNRYTAEGTDGMIAFASSFPGAIKALEISSGHSMIVQKSAFLASEEGVELSMHFQKKLGKGIFGGEGFIMQRLSGNGTAFVEIDGHAVEYDLSAGQEMVISTGYLAAMGETCTMDIVTVKGVAACGQKKAPEKKKTEQAETKFKDRENLKLNLFTVYYPNWKKCIGSYPKEKSFSDRNMRIFQKIQICGKPFR